MDAIEHPLVTVLNEQIRCAEEMLATLSRENRALLDGDAETLGVATAEKARLAAALETLESRRRTLTSQVEAAFDSLGADAQWRSMLELVAACKRQNLRNGALVKARTEQVRTALKWLRGAEPALYDVTGHTPVAKGARSLGSA
jgi:flagellar biosynthesis/type III secretory pathway chaperone